MVEQFGFKTKHSTRSQILHVGEFFSENFNKNIPTAAIFLNAVTWNGNTITSNMTNHTTLHKTLFSLVLTIQECYSISHISIKFVSLCVKFSLLFPVNDFTQRFA